MYAKCFQIFSKSSKFVEYHIEDHILYIYNIIYIYIHLAVLHSVNFIFPTEAPKIEHYLKQGSTMSEFGLSKVVYSYFVGVGSMR